MKIAMIMLAAGNSRRFGGNKLLYEIDGIPMYSHVLQQLEKSMFHVCSEHRMKNNNDKIECNITVVTQYEAIAEAAAAKGMQVLYNPHPEHGISSSVQIGLNANLDADAVLFTVSDQPWLTDRTILALIHVLLNSDRGIACVSYQGKQGNPCIFSRKYYDELLALEGDKGGKKVIMKHLDDTQICEVQDARELEDIDYKI